MGSKGKAGLDFSGKVVLITGAASGIGAATAEMFSKLGACLTLVDREEEGLLCLMKKCIKTGREPYGIAGDLLKPVEIECIARKTTERFGGKLDVLVNGAGVMPTGTLQSTELACFTHVMEANVRSAFYLTKLLLPHLLQCKGNIINVSSVGGLRAFPNQVAYNMSKAAVDQFTRSLALDLAPQGVRVNAVNPGVIRTNLHKAGGMDEQSYADFLESSKQTHALGRIGEPTEVASVICFLASELASFVTGVTLPVDGGKQLMCPR
ncbi:3-oxoacyl-[acyl-carrier-protein] reductase FabG [Drosophila rhopaloa]|uniref:3-oxoacyl-[acyl-carrier-protein] reductase FabG-like n=1 Tax=Drosophila rhopaloa TaxID=1041015 RepID=A0A6P4F7J2_DRORH|nr:3-oxoacyl-[acyl-carrier-protein] reductase FabG [Drosophila rhopaloa]